MVGEGYVQWQMAKSLMATADALDAADRERAVKRIDQWHRVIEGMTSGTVQVGERTPVEDLPAWVSLEVARGGFATGRATAEGPLAPDEDETATQLGVLPSRALLFAYALTESGIAELQAMLRSNCYRVPLPEQAALLVVAWLLQHGDQAAAVEVLDEITPFADRLRFTPTPSPTPLPDPGLVSRQTAGEARAALLARKPNPAVQTMREAVTVWAPFADEVLSHWQAVQLPDTGPVSALPDEWRRAGRALLDRYATLASFNTRCTKHRRPKENLAILLRGLETATSDGSLTDRQAGWVRTAVTAMTARRGAPGSPQLTALRRRQLEDAERPLYSDLARVVAGRLAMLPSDGGLTRPGDVLSPVTSVEAAAVGLPEEAPLPGPVVRVVHRTLAGSIEELIAAGGIPSAEVLASLAPQLGASTTARSYEDPALSSLMAANYRAFRSRRSLLLLDLNKQVQLEELPWVQAAQGHRRTGARQQSQALITLARLGALTLETFPATVLPNMVVTELRSLASEAGLRLPWVEELAADIFMGTFSPKYLAAAKLAGELFADSLYARYYDIDYAAVLRLPDEGRPQPAPPWWRRKRSPGTSATGFADLCHQRVGRKPVQDWTSWSVAANGTVIEQAQILTTHNLATLVGPAGVAPTRGWPWLAVSAFKEVCREVDHLAGNPRPLRTVKDAAYGWRQVMAYLSLCTPDETVQARSDIAAVMADRWPPTRRRLGFALTGLDAALEGAVPQPTDRLLGWTTAGHRLLESTDTA